MQSHLHPVWLPPWSLAVLLPWTFGELPLPSPLSILTLPCPIFRVESALSLGQCWLSESNQALYPGTCSPVVTAVPLDRALRLTLKEWCCQACPGFLGCTGRITKAPFSCALLSPSVCSFGDWGSMNKGSGTGRDFLGVCRAPP